MPDELDQYDAIGGNWESAADLPLFEALHRSFPALVGDVRGLDVLDVATGTGPYARRWAAAGARRVVASDRSVEMIAAAREIESTEPSGVEYHVADAVDGTVLGSFDVVTAAFLLNYARDTDTMAAMARTLYANLRPGGRLVGALPHPEFPLDSGMDLTPFGMLYTVGEQVEVGTVTGMRLLTEPPIDFDFVLVRREVYEEGLRRAGFTPPRWVPLHERDPEHPRPRIDGLAEAAPCILFEATRPG